MCEFSSLFFTGKTALLRREGQKRLDKANDIVWVERDLKLVRLSEEKMTLLVHKLVRLSEAESSEKDKRTAEPQLCWKKIE
jgi:hypothetical protein